MNTLNVVYLALSNDVFFLKQVSLFLFIYFLDRTRARVRSCCGAATVIALHSFRKVLNTSQVSLSNNRVNSALHPSGVDKMSTSLQESGEIHVRIAWSTMKLPIGAIQDDDHHAERDPMSMSPYAGSG